MRDAGLWFDKKNKYQNEMRQQKENDQPALHREYSNPISTGGVGDR